MTHMLCDFKAKLYVGTGLPFGIPGIGLLMLGAVQQAPQLGRHSMVNLLWVRMLFSTNRILSIGHQTQRHFLSHVA